MRADARAKRAALQTAGAELFAEQGTDVPLSAVAVRAGWGSAPSTAISPREGSSTWG